MVQSQCDLERDLKDPLAEEGRPSFQLRPGRHLYRFLRPVLRALPGRDLSSLKGFRSDLI